MAQPLHHLTPQAVQGDLSTHPPAHLVLYAHEKRLTGTLELGPPGAPHVTVVFVDGLVRKTRGVHPNYLGGILYELGFIDANMLNETLRDVAKKRRPHGQILLERRAITRAQLSQGLKEQTERRLTHLFAMSRAFPWRFHPEVDALDGWGGSEWPDVSPVAAIWRAMREGEPDALMSRAMACIADHPLRLKSSIDLAQFEFTEEELGIVLRMREPVRRSDLEDPGSKRPVERVLYGLLLARKLEVLDPTGQVAPLRRLTPPPNSEIAIQERGQPQRRLPTFSMRVPAPGYAGSGEHAAVKASGTQLRAVRPVAPADAKTAEAMRESIRLRAQTIAFEDYFHALGVQRDASPSDVRATFFRLARIWHPDRLPPDLLCVHDECVTVFTQLTLAYRTLTNADTRMKYVAELELKGAEPVPQPGEPVADPQEDFRAAEAALAQGNIARAEGFAQRALRNWPEDGDCAALVTWLEALRPENQDDYRSKRLIDKLDAILESSPACIKAYWYRAMLHKRVNNLRLAIQDLRDVLSLQPRHEGAMRELRLFELRIKNGTIPRGSLSAKAAAASAAASAAPPRAHDSIGEMVVSWLRRKD